jgi:ubiquinone/menaquinone biosynthesis C-methylase UbiE
MKTMEESITLAMECQNAAILPFLPYILQDMWEMGTPPEIVISLVQKHCKNYSDLTVLDLGCGKGAVSVKLAAALKCSYFGIDGISDFVETAKTKAKEYGVDALCRFEAGDIREKIKELGQFDVIILGAIGPVFGDYEATLTTLSKHITKDGIIIINDAYIDDSDSFHLLKNPTYSSIMLRTELLKQVGQTEMELIDENASNYDEFADGDQEMKNIAIRCGELKTKYPKKTALFEKYEQEQNDGYDDLKNVVDGAVMVFKKKRNE